MIISRITSPCWLAVTRRVSKEPPSRVRSTCISYVVAVAAAPDEIEVQRLRTLVGLDSGACCRERLRGDQSAEQPRTGSLGRLRRDERVAVAVELKEPCDPALS